MANNTERFTSVSGQLAQQKLEACRIDAVIGSKVPSEDLRCLYDAKKNKAKYHRDLSPGEIGCYLSHRKIWQKMIDENIPYACILEDDVVLQDNVNIAINLANNLKGWDIIKLGNNRSDDIYQTKLIDNEHSLISYYRVPNCTHGYLISLAGAKKMLQRTKIFRPIDIDMQFHSELNLFIAGLLPYSVNTNDEFESDIVLQNNGRHSNKSTFLRNLKHRYHMYQQRKKPSADINQL